jgi:peptide/nickel transport system permease protein
MDYVLYIVRRLLAAVPVLFGVTVIVFFMIHMVPGNPAVTLLGTHATSQAVAALDQQLGLNKSVWQQYLEFLGRLLHGNLGHSYFYNASVTSLVLGRLSATIWLIVAGAVFAVVISVPLAVWAASRRNGVADNMIRAVPLLGLGMPSFWLGIMLVLVFALKLRLFPVSGFGTTIPEHLLSIVLPGLTVALSLVPILIRSLRTSMINVLGSDYITTARAKGLSASRVAFGHALRNAAISSVTVLGVNIAYLIGATLVIESVFSLPGIGILMVEAIFDRDFPVVQGVTMVFAILVVAVNLLTDIAHASLDPRVRLNP